MQQTTILFLAIPLLIIPALANNGFMLTLLYILTLYVCPQLTICVGVYRCSMSSSGHCCYHLDDRKMTRSRGGKCDHRIHM